MLKRVMSMVAVCPVLAVPFLGSALYGDPTIDFAVPELGFQRQGSDEYLVHVPPCIRDIGADAAIAVVTGRGRVVWRVEANRAVRVPSFAIGDAPPGMQVEDRLKHGLAADREFNAVVTAGQGRGLAFGVFRPSDLRRDRILVDGRLVSRQTYQRMAREMCLVTRPNDQA